MQLWSSPAPSRQPASWWKKLGQMHSSFKHPQISASVTTVQEEWNRLSIIRCIVKYCWFGLVDWIASLEFLGCPLVTRSIWIQNQVKAKISLQKVQASFDEIKPSWSQSIPRACVFWHKASTGDWVGLRASPAWEAQYIEMSSGTSVLIKKLQPHIQIPIWHHNPTVENIREIISSLREGRLYHKTY